MYSFRVQHDIESDRELEEDLPQLLLNVFVYCILATFTTLSWPLLLGACFKVLIELELSIPHTKADAV